jgi:quercetin dioxygenase-like cupin family protein
MLMQEARVEPGVLKLAESASYQQGSIVSRQIISRKTGTVTLFAFDQGQELSEHTAPYDAMVYVLDGEAHIRIAGRPFVLQPGDMINMPANQPHAVKAEQRFKMLLIMVRSQE